MLWSSHLSISIKLCLSRSDLYAYFFFLLFLTLKHKWFTCCWMNIPQILKGAMTISTLPVIGFNVATEWATTLLWNHSAILFRDIFFFLQKSHSKITSVVLILHRALYIFFISAFPPFLLKTEASCKADSRLWGAHPNPIAGPLIVVGYWTWDEYSTVNPSSPCALSFYKWV